jgi:hypothetical protein
MDALDKRKVSLTTREPKHVRTNSRQITICTELLEMKANFAVSFSLLCYARSEEKEKKGVIFYSVSYNIRF